MVGLAGMIKTKRKVAWISARRISPVQARNIDTGQSHREMSTQRFRSNGPVAGLTTAR